MTPYYQRGPVTIYHGRSEDVLPTLGTVGSVVTDPPYGLSFMGRGWDRGVPPADLWRLVLDVLPSGGHLLACGGARTFHRLTCAIEDAGFDIRDCVMWLHGQGFPKGRGQLKPAWEPVILARKPGPAPWLNVDGCRFNTGAVRASKGGFSNSPIYGTGRPGFVSTGAAGRWPANVALSHLDDCEEVGTRRVRSGTAHRTNGGGNTFGGDSAKPSLPDLTYADPDGTETVAAWSCAPGCPVAMLDAQSGERTSTRSARGGASGNQVYGAFADPTRYECGYGDTGGASRFMYTSKASKRERGEGNDWPTVKPLALMRWLIRLVTPPGTTVLDPFMGSGSTLIAAHLEGFPAIGIDADEHACEIAARRLDQAVLPMEVTA